MSPLLIGLTILAFGIGMAVAWVQARRRIKAQVLDKMVEEAEIRIRNEVLERVKTQLTEEQLAEFESRQKENQQTHSNTDNSTKKSSLGEK